MKKRLSKSESKRQAKRIRIKKRQKSSDSVTLEADLRQWSKFKWPVVNFTLATLAVLIISSFYTIVPTSLATNTLENDKSITLSPAFRPDSMNTALADEDNLNLEQIKLEKTKKLHHEILSIVKNTPMEIMSEDISKREKPVAAFLVGIALKESQFGIHSPKKNGADCFNYWGYRGKESPTQSGYSCFKSPSEAVKIVGNRIETIVKQGAKTPADMVVWKCGSSCVAFDNESVNKWIEDVGINYYRLNPKGEIAKK